MAMRLLLLLLLLLVVPARGRALELPAVRLLVSNATPYFGEELVVTLEILTTPRPPGTMVPIWPALDNCAVTELPPQPPRLEETADGPVLVQGVRRAIRPLRAGRLPLSSSGVSLAGVTYTAAPLDLRVLPLPETGQPEGFAGAIGHVDMRLEESGRGSREVRLILHGQAPLDDFPVPLAEYPVDERLIQLDDRTSGETPEARTRVLRYLYLPGDGARGRLTFRLPLFDPTTRRYSVLHAGVRRTPLWLADLLVPLAGLCLLGILLHLARRSRSPASIAATLERLGSGPHGPLNREQQLQQLQLRGGTAELLAELARYWASCDRQRFAPDATAPPPFDAARERRLRRQLLRLTSRKTVDKSRPIS